MGTVGYKNQPGLKSALLADGGGAMPLEGNADHVYTVTGVLWPEQVEAKIRSLLLSNSLHVCSGLSRLGDVRVDLYHDSDVTADAARLPFRDESFATVLCDPPFTGGYQWNHDLLSELSRVARDRIVFQHWFMPADPRGYWKKFHRFRLSSLYVWQPRTYFGRAQLVSVFDRDPMRLF